MEKSFLKNLAVVSLTAMLAISPLFAYAKNDKGNNGNENRNRVEKQINNNRGDDNKDNDNKNRTEKENDNNSIKNTQNCWQSYGHFFAFGWLRKNQRPQVNMDCFLPFGIAKKIRDYRWPNASTTPTATIDTIAPVISNIKTRTNSVNAIVSWTTNENADSAVFWSTTTPVDLTNSSIPNITNGNSIKNHEIKVAGLSTSTTYYAIVRSKDAAGNIATSSQFSFTTKSTAAAVDTAAPVINSVIAVVGTSTVNVAWQTNELSTSKVYYSTTTPLDKLASSTLFVESDTLLTAHLMSIMGLSTSTTYYTMVESQDAAGNIKDSNQFSFTTSPGI